jgi:hypothetical protein
MEWLDSVVAVGLGVLLRVGIPVLITIFLVRWLRGLDERWQAEAHTETTQAQNIGCWEIKGCTAEQRATCQAYANQDTPCFQVFRDTNGNLKEECIGCQVFRETPMAVPIPIVK